MAFLEIDGLPIPVAAGSVRQQFNFAGGLDRVASGRAVSSRKACKRKWQFKTTPLPHAQAESLRCLLEARGRFWPFAGNAFAADGYAPSSATGLGYLTGLTVGDLITTRQRMTTDVPFGHYLGVQSVSANAATTNLLDADTASFGSGTGYWAGYGSGVVTRDAAVSIDGTSQSMKVMNGHAQIETFPGSFAAGSKYTLSGYFRAAAGSPSVGINLYDNTNSVGDSAGTGTLSSTKWTRVSVTITIGASTCTGFRMLLLQPDEGLGFYADKLQLELNDYVTPWIAGGTSRSAGSLNLTGATHSPFTGSYDKAWTIGLWCTNGPAGGSLFYQSSGHRLYANGADFIWAVPGAPGATISAAMPTTAGGWSRLDCVCYLDSSGVTHHKLYLNGALADYADSDAGETFPELSNLPDFYVGCGGGSVWPGRIANLMALPVALDATTIASLFNSGNGGVVGSWPAHRVTGDLIGAESSVDCLAEVTEAEFVSMGGASWANNCQSLSVDLWER